MRGRTQLVIAICCGVSLPAMAQDQADSRPLREQEVVALALAHAPRLRASDASLALQRARESTAGRRENPTLSWTREAIATEPGGSQDIVSIAVPFDFTGPSTRRTLAEAQTAWAETRHTLSRLDFAAEALMLYSDWVVSHQRVAMLEDALVGLDEASRVMLAREQAGATSGYDSSRLTIARSLGQSRLAEAVAERHALGGRLALVTGLRAGSFRPDGPLMLNDDSPSVETPPVITQAQRVVRLAGDAREQAEWSWLPTLELMGGLKRVSDSGGGLGYTFGITVSVPIFDRGQGLRAETVAMHAAASAQVDTLARTIQEESEVARVLRDATRAELDRFESDAAEAVQTLLVAARSGYREGTLSIVDLLDAERTQLEVLERRIALLRQAKHAEIRFRAANGTLL